MNALWFALALVVIFGLLYVWYNRILVPCCQFGSTRNSPVFGFFCALLLGPFGLPLVKLIDCRVRCRTCGGRMPVFWDRCLGCESEENTEE